MGTQGRAGCGCLIFILVVCMVAIGIMIHPFTLKLLGNQLRYEDKIIPADAIFVPRFQEDKNGELYTEAFREYHGGFGRIILLENDSVLGMSITDLVLKMAKARGLKDGSVKGLDAQGNERLRSDKIREQFHKMGLKKVIILVPEYASRRYHLLYSSSAAEGSPLYLVKPVAVSYYTRDKWWKEGSQRMFFLKELYSILAEQLQRFKYGDKK